MLRFQIGIFKGDKKMKQKTEMVAVSRHDDLTVRLNALAERDRGDMTSFLEKELNRAQEMIRMMDSKTSAILLIAGGVAGSIVFKMLSDGSGRNPATWAFVATLALLAGSGVCGGMAVLPRIYRSWKTIVFHARPKADAHRPLNPHYFGDICLHASSDDYLLDVLETSLDSTKRLRALSDQVRINAEVAFQKSLWVSRSALCLKSGIVTGLIGGALKYLLFK